MFEESAAYIFVFLAIRSALTFATIVVCSLTADSFPKLCAHYLNPRFHMLV